MYLLEEVVADNVVALEMYRWLLEEEEVNRVKISGAKAIVVVLGSEGCRCQDGFSGVDLLLNSKGQSRYAFLMLLPISSPGTNVQQCRKENKV